MYSPPLWISQKGDCRVEECCVAPYISWLVQITQFTQYFPKNQSEIISQPHPTSSADARQSFSLRASLNMSSPQLVPYFDELDGCRDCTEIWDISFEMLLVVSTADSSVGKEWTTLILLIPGRDYWPVKFAVIFYQATLRCHFVRSVCEFKVLYHV